MKRLLILKTGSKPSAMADLAGDYEDWLLAGMGLPRRAARVVAAADGEGVPPPERVAAVIITGSPAMVTDRPAWMVTWETWLRDAVARQIPLLGICFGHQWLAQTLGGRVEYNGKGLEVGTVQLRLSEAARGDPLFAGLPSLLAAQASHRQVVAVLPSGAIPLARNDLDAHQAVRYGANAWGVQFHPEFSDEVSRRFIALSSDLLREEGKAWETLAATVRATPGAAAILRRFARLAGLGAS